MLFNFIEKHTKHIRGKYFMKLNKYIIHKMHNVCLLAQVHTRKINNTLQLRPLYQCQ